MSVKLMKQHNDDTFIKDFKRVKHFMAFAPTTRIFLSVKKSDVRREAERRKISYYISDKIFVVKREVMIIL